MPIYSIRSFPDGVFLLVITKLLGLREEQKMKRKRLGCFLGVAVLVTALCVGCGTQNTATKDADSQEVSTQEVQTEEETGSTQEVQTEEENSSTQEEDSSTSEDEENYETGDASLDNTRNQNEIGEQELLVVSFGTSYNDSRRLTIGAIENKLEEAFPEYSVRRGFTSQIIIDHVKKRDGAVIDNVGEALDRAVDNGVKTLVVQPTHLMNGLEYNDLVEELTTYSDAFEKVAIGEPLLSSDEDFQAVMDVITKETAQYDDGETAICFMGHGTTADSNSVYAKMQETLHEAGYDNYYIGTVEADPDVEDVLEAVSKGNYKKVVLEPLMIVAGDHANNDMAGDEEDSWKTSFENAGYEVTCIIRGLGELEGIQDIFVQHAQAAIDSLQE
jgi:sirohydrochlorin cobaltochelatase